MWNVPWEAKLQRNFIASETTRDESMSLWVTKSINQPMKMFIVDN